MLPVPADAFVGDLCQRDFKALGRLLTPQVRMRALLPSRYLEAGVTGLPRGSQAGSADRRGSTWSMPAAETSPGGPACIGAFR